MNRRKLLLPVSICFLVCLTSITALAQQPNTNTAESPKVVAAAAPIYSPVAFVVRAQGEVVVKVWINQSGAVFSAASTTGQPLLRKLAEAAAHLWKFEPANDKSETRTANLIFSFHIDDGNPTDPDATSVFMPPNKVEVTRKIPPIVHTDISRRSRSIRKPSEKISNND